MPAKPNGNGRRLEWRSSTPDTDGRRSATGDMEYYPANGPNVLNTKEMPASAAVRAQSPIPPAADQFNRVVEFARWTGSQRRSTGTELARLHRGRKNSL